jgi:hypothetical protein
MDKEIIELYKLIEEPGGIYTFPDYPGLSIQIYLHLTKDEDDFCVVHKRYKIVQLIGDRWESLILLPEMVLNRFFIETCIIPQLKEMVLRKPILG